MDGAAWMADSRYIVQYIELPLIVRSGWLAEALYCNMYI